MKTETKTGRWKYAAIVLIVTLLVGLFWSYVKNGPKGEIYLYGEEHSKQSILDKELSIWGEYPSGASITKKECGICLWNSRIRMHNF